MKRQRNMFQIEEHDRTSGKDLNNAKESNLSEKEFKVMVIKMLMELGGRVVNTVRTSTELESTRKDQEGGLLSGSVS